MCKNKTTSKGDCLEVASKNPWDNTFPCFRQVSVFHSGRYCTIIGCSGLLSTCVSSWGVYLVCCSLAWWQRTSVILVISRDGCFCTIYSYSRARHVDIYIYWRANFVSFSCSVCILCVRIFWGTLTGTNINVRFRIQALWFSPLDVHQKWGTLLRELAVRLVPKRASSFNRRHRTCHSGTVHTRLTVALP